MGSDETENDVAQTGLNEKDVAQTGLERIPAVGDLVIGGVLVYEIQCIFWTPDRATKLVHFNASGFGEVFDVGNGEVEGWFVGNPQLFVGACRCSLEEAEVEGGGVVFTLRKGGEVIGRFLGPAEGFGEAVVAHKKGHLHIVPSIHKNEVRFIGDSTVGKIDFELLGECITVGQPYHGTHRDWKSSKKANELTIDVKCGRYNSKPPADYFRDAAHGGKDNVLTTAMDDRWPSKLNFAITGMLYIDQQEFIVCLGQGHDGFYHPWYFTSDQLVYGRGLSKDPYRVHLGDCIIEVGSDDYSFKVRREP